MATTNTLQQVITYNDSALALLQNSYAFIANANKKFKDFDKKTPMNLGSSIDFDLPPRMIANNSLVVSFEDVEQRSQRLTVDQQASVPIAFSAQELIFNVKDYMDKFGRSAIAEIGAKVEANVALNAETQPYRFYGDGVTPVSTSAALATALAFYRNYGAPRNKTKMILPDLTYPAIINSNANQFTLDRNNREIMSWELGNFSGCEFYQSNLLPTHIAGSEGINASTLTVVSVVKNADDAVTSIVFSGTNGASDADSVKQYDSFQFSDGVSGQPDMRFRTFIGHEVSQSPVQFSATADAASTGASQVTVTVNPPLKASSGINQNINNEIVAGMQATVLPSHRCGILWADDALYLGMPALPNEDPFPTAVSVDPESGCSMRMYKGALFGQNQRGIVHDAIWGSTMPGEYAMKIALPL